MMANYKLIFIEVVFLILVLSASRLLEQGTLFRSLCQWTCIICFSCYLCGSIYSYKRSWKYLFDVIVSLFIVFEISKFIEWQLDLLPKYHEVWDIAILLSFIAITTYVMILSLLSWLVSLMVNKMRSRKKYP